MKSITLTVSAAASLAKIDRKTLSRRLREAGEEAGENGEFTLSSIFNALLSGTQELKRRKLEAETRLAELNLSRAENAVVPTEGVLRVWDSALRSLRAVVMGTSLPKMEQHRLLRQLQQAFPPEAYAQDVALPAVDNVEEES